MLSIAPPILSCDRWGGNLIQGSTVRAVMGRDDIVVWPVTTANQLTSPSAITRCLIHCKRDGESDVIIDSADVPDAFVFNEQATVRGKLVNVLKWMPGLAVGEQFTETAKWKCQVFLFDAVHASGVGHGAFWLELVFTELPAVGAAVAYVLGSLDLFSTDGPPNTIIYTAVNSMVDPEMYPDAVAVLTIAARREDSASDFPVPTSVTIGGVTADVVGLQGTSGFGTARQYLFVATARIPPGGFTTSDVVIDWTGISSIEPYVRGRLEVLYNVDESSDAFSLGSATADDAGSVGSLNAPTGGAVYVASIQYTGGDFDSYAQSTVDETAYQQPGDDVLVASGHYHMSAYRLFSSDITESIGPNPFEVFLPAIAFVMAGTG